MFDSLNRHMLPNYGCELGELLPNFKRLGEKAVTFDNCYVGSLPCMPARRELHTGRYNFLHRGWGPLEPFDDSMPELLRKKGIHTHLATDHSHYWEDGGSTYHNRFSTYEFIRGQEGDKWVGYAAEIPSRDLAVSHLSIQRTMMQQDNKNLLKMQKEEDTCIARTFANGLEFIDTNAAFDNWYLQIECFDPHEPFYATENYRSKLKQLMEGKDVYWPAYDFVKESDEVVERGKMEYFALLMMCDEYVGKLLDAFDKHNLWEDTMLIVNTDHGYLLGEHGWWSKTIMPVYNEIANIPLFIHDPRCPKGGERREALIQTIDLAPTLLDFFSVDLPKDMDGKPLGETIASHKEVREYALFGYHEGHINITDGKYVYMRAPISEENTPLMEHTFMPCDMRNMFGIERLKRQEPSREFSFTKGTVPNKYPSGFSVCRPYNFGTKLFDLEADPKQDKELSDTQVELRMMQNLVRLMVENDAPDDQFQRMGISKNNPMTAQILEELNKLYTENKEIKEFSEYQFSGNAKAQLRALLIFIPKDRRDAAIAGIKQILAAGGVTVIDSNVVYKVVDTIIPKENKEMINYFVSLSGRSF